MANVQSGKKPKVKLGRIIIGRHADAKLTYRLGRPGKKLAMIHERNRLLTEKGIRQALAFSATLRKYDFKAKMILTSGLSRTDQTAILATGRAVVDLHIANLYERYFAGDAMKVLNDSKMSLLEMFQAEETILMRMEICGAIDPILESAEKGDVYVVCHGIVAEFLAYLLTSNKEVLKRRLETCEALLIDGKEISWLAP